MGGDGFVGALMDPFPVDSGNATGTRVEGRATVSEMPDADEDGDTDVSAMTSFSADSSSGKYPFEDVGTELLDEFGEGSVDPDSSEAGTGW